MTASAPDIVPTAEGREAPPRWLVPATGYAVVLVGFAMVSALGGWSPPSALTDVIYVPLNIAFIVAFGAASRRASLEGGERRALLALAATYVCALLGNVMISLDELSAAFDATSTWANVPYLIYYVVGTWGLLQFPVAAVSEVDRAKFRLDLASIVISGAVLAGIFVIDPLVDRRAPPFTLLVDASFAVGTIAMLAALARALLLESPASRSGGFPLLAIGLFVQLLIDLFYQLRYVDRRAPTIAWLDIPFAIGYVLLLLAAARYARAPAAESRPAPLQAEAANLLPLLCALVGYVALVWAAVTGWTHGLMPFAVSAIVLTVLLHWRQALTVRQNVRLLLERAEAERMATYEDRTREAQKLEAVGRLAGGIAHDFNNLLTTILANCELALHREGAAAVREEIEDVRGAANRASDLTRQLLAFARRQPVEPAPIDPRVVVRDFERLLSRLAGERHTLVVDIVPGTSMVVADRSQLEQVLLNLVANARDAMPEGGVIELSLLDVALSAGAARGLDVPPGPYVLMAVRDTGIGIPHELRTNIFEPFFSTKPVGQGTGLGLASTYGIVRQSGGAIAVESEPGRGSCFRVHLPAVPAPVPAPAPAPAVPAEAITQGTILLVEDDVHVRRAVVRMLGKLGFDVLSAVDAPDARRVMQEEGARVQLLVSDVMMPGDTGPALAASLRHDWPDLPVLFISGYPGEAMELAGNAPLLLKPFTSDEMAARIREVLGAARTAPGAAR